jgi:GTPase SAR1 family protein
MDFDLHIKLILLGDSSVGKTNMLARFREKDFQEGAMQTIGCDTYAKTYNISGKSIQA